MEAEDKTKYRDESPEEPDVEAHRFFTEEPAEDDAGKTKTKFGPAAADVAAAEARDKYRNKY
jgi:hypothetical protein